MGTRIEYVHHSAEALFACEASKPKVIFGYVV